MTQDQSDYYIYGSRFWSHLMIEQLLKRGWTVGFYNTVDGYDVDTWTRLDRPLKHVHHMDLEIQPSVHRHEWGKHMIPNWNGRTDDGIFMRLYEDGALDVNIENPRTRQAMDQVIRSEQHVFRNIKGRVRLDNPLGTTVARFESDEQAAEPRDEAVHGFEYETWDITRVDELTDLILRYLLD